MTPPLPRMPTDWRAMVGEPEVQFSPSVSPLPLFSLLFLLALPCLGVASQVAHALC